MRRLRHALAPLAFLVPAVACAPTEGDLTFSTWGEEYIEKGIPASEFADGWGVTFDTFLVVLDGVEVSDGTSSQAKMPRPKLFNHVVPAPKPVFSAGKLPARAYTQVSFMITPVTADTELGQGATEADKALMTKGGYSVYVAGKAQKGAEQKRFAWGFTTKTLFADCRVEEAGKEVLGVVVTSGGSLDAELTIHGDHLFYDDLQAPDAKLRFQNLADADANKDGEVTLAELAAVKLARLPKENGPYGTGSAADVTDLGAFVTGLTRTVGHFRGEGECIARAR
jgi:hypothetical protein